MEKSFDNALQILSDIQFSINFIVVLSLGFAIYCAYSLRQEIKKLKHSANNKENFIFKSSALAGIYFLFGTEFLVIAFVGLTYSAFDIFLKLITISMGGVAFVIAFLNFQRKSGVELEFTYIPKEQAKLFHHVRFFLENLKDKAVIIDEMVIEIKGTTLELPVDFPLVLKGYEPMEIQFEVVAVNPTHEKGLYLRLPKYITNNEPVLLPDDIENKKGIQIIEKILEGNFKIKISSGGKEYLVPQRQISSIKPKDESYALITQKGLDNVVKINKLQEYKKNSSPKNPISLNVTSNDRNKFLDKYSEK